LKRPVRTIGVRDGGLAHPVDAHEHHAAHAALHAARQDLLRVVDLALAPEQHVAGLHGVRREQPFVDHGQVGARRRRSKRLRVQHVRPHHPLDAQGVAPALVALFAGEEPQRAHQLPAQARQRTRQLLGAVAQLAALGLALEFAQARPREVPGGQQAAQLAQLLLHGLAQARAEEGRPGGGARDEVVHDRLVALERHPDHLGQQLANLARDLLVRHHVQLAGGQLGVERQLALEVLQRGQERLHVPRDLVRGGP
jgi:hypothetical protein